MGVFPPAMRGRQVSPRGAGAKTSEHGVDESGVVLRNATPNPGSSGQTGLKQGPVPVAEVVSVKRLGHLNRRFIANNTIKPQRVMTRPSLRRCRNWRAICSAADTA